MKILIISRLYTGLYDSIIKKKWQPSGMPTFVELIEGLEKRNIPFDVVFLKKSIDNRFYEKQIIRLDEFNANFFLYPACRVINYGKSCKRLEGLAYLIQDVIHLLYCLKIFYKNTYDIVYVDRANVPIGAFFAFFLRKKVVLRLHGVLKLYNQFIRWITKYSHPVKYYSYFAPFKFIICSQDGTAADLFLKEFRSKRVPYNILLNGSHKNEKSIQKDNTIRKKYDIPKTVPIILFLGRLEEDKGCELFVQSLIKLNNINRNFYSLIVGNGSLYNEISTLIRNYNLRSKIILTGTVDHKLVKSFYEESDIYVSLNMLGNLSNTVLESINAGNCIITLKKSQKLYTDISTERYLKDYVFFIDRNNVINELITILNELLTNPKKINEARGRMRTLSNILLKSWSDRISYEIDLLEKVNKGEEALARFAQN